MIDILREWNRWGENPLPSGHKRDIVERVYQLIDLPEVVALVGMRRVGKTTVLYQVMDHLETQGVNPQAMLYVNFEDPGFANHLTPDLLDQIYRTFREEVCPSGKTYLFLDEIQIVPEWERWVSARNVTEDVKIFVSGSSAQLMSRELATLLTGRHISLQIHPLSFVEFCRFHQIDLPNRPHPIKPPPIVQSALNEYITWGGLPRVVIEEKHINKRALLRGYFDDILFKDIAMRHNIRNITMLRDLAIYLFTQTGSLISFTKLANRFNVSQEMMQNYCAYIEESFLVSYLPFYSLKISEQNRRGKKCHVHDLGFRNIANMSHSKDLGKCVETAVYNATERDENDGVFYWQQNCEIDLVLRHGVDVTHLIQVVYDGLDSERIYKREISALQQAQKHFPKAEKILIAAKLPQVLPALPDQIKLIPLWRYLTEGLN